EIFVAAFASKPKSVKRAEDMARHLERDPNPMRAGIRSLDLDLAHMIFLIEQNGIEEFGPLDGKEQERQLIVRENADPILREPDRVRKADRDRFVIGNQRDRAEDRVAEAGGARLHHISRRNGTITLAVIFEYVGFTRP